MDNQVGGRGFGLCVVIDDGACVCVCVCGSIDIDTYPSSSFYSTIIYYSIRFHSIGFWCRRSAVRIYTSEPNNTICMSHHRASLCLCLFLSHTHDIHCHHPHLSQTEKRDITRLAGRHAAYPFTTSAAETLDVPHGRRVGRAPQFFATEEGERHLARWASVWARSKT